MQNAKLYTNAEIFEFDIADFDNLTQNAKKCLELFDNRVDVLVNNAGIGVRSSVEELSIENFLKVFNVNVFGLSLFTKQIIPSMKAQKSGTIINIGSTASLKGYKNGSIYSSSKFASLRKSKESLLRYLSTSINKRRIQTRTRNCWSNWSKWSR